MKDYLVRMNCGCQVRFYAESMYRTAMLEVCEAHEANCPTAAECRDEVMRLAREEINARVADSTKWN